MEYPTHLWCLPKWWWWYGEFEPFISSYYEKEAVFEILRMKNIDECKVFYGISNTCVALDDESLLVQWEILILFDMH